MDNENIEEMEFGDRRHPESLKKELLNNLLESFKILLMTLVLAFIVKTFLVEPFLIPSESMENTLMVGDRIIVEKIGHYLGEEYKRGEIVVFQTSPEAEVLLIKRIIAIGGDTVELRDGEVYINGEKSEEPYTREQNTTPLNKQVDFPMTIPDGEVLLLGDNRGNSADGRIFGTISEDLIIGKALFRYWPLDSFGPVE